MVATLTVRRLFGMLCSCPSMLAILTLGCSGDPSPAPATTDTPAVGTYSIALTATTAAALPKCTSTLAGTTALVQSPVGLWACSAGSWSPIACTKSLAGAVAYASESKTLLACVAGSWVQIVTPAGPKGDTGATGATGAQGAQGLKGDTGAAGPAGSKGDVGATGGPGPKGDPGSQGPKGDPGANGQPGAPGTVLSIKPEAAGPNCAGGGQKIDSGPDTNGNGILEPAEIRSTQYVCSGVTGPQGPVGPAGAAGVTTLASSAAEAAGPNCASGGVKLSFGADTNANGSLEAAEVTSSSFVCNGAPGATGATGQAGSSSLVSSEPEPAGLHCAAGGVKLSFGTDANANGSLDPVEVSNNSYLCNIAPPTASGCSVAADCGADTECAVRTCVAGTCGFNFMPAGTLLANQIAGDCQTAVCDGAGNPSGQAADLDLPNDDNECTSDQCVAGVRAFANLPRSTVCSQAGGGSCDGAGRCVPTSACTVASDCAQATECAQPTCTAGACGSNNAPAGTPVASQTPGDCRAAVCDGTGNVATVRDDSDRPDDGNQCTADACIAGVPGFTMAPYGTACSQAGGTICNGAGVCVSACGNGITTAPETCDDGNAAQGDGCSSSCSIEPGFTCSGAPSYCLGHYFQISPGALSVLFELGSGGAVASAPTVGTFPVVLAPPTGGGGAPDLCNPAFDGSIVGAVVLAQRGTCSFYVKATNAQAAGAAAIVVYNNNLAQPGVFTSNIAGTPPIGIPFAGISNADGMTIRTLLTNQSVALTWLP